MDREAALHKRIDQLTLWREAAQTPIMIFLYNRALDSTNGLTDVLVRLEEAAARELQAHQDFMDDSLDESTRRIAEFDAHVKNLNSHKERLAQSKHASAEDQSQLNRETDALLELRTLEARQFNLQYMQDLHDKRSSSFAALDKALWEKIIKPDAKAFRKAAAMQAVETALGFVASLAGPVGELHEVIWSIVKLSQFDSESAKAAEAHITYVQDYYEAMETWCAAAEHMINRLEAAVASFP